MLLHTVFPIAHAETGDMEGPIACHLMLICAAAALDIMEGTRLGLTRLGPFWCKA